MNLLFLENDDALHNLACNYLKKQFNVIPASNGEEALELFYKNKVDCILLDLVLPCISGLEFLKRIRNKGVNTPVIIVTGTNCHEDLQCAVNLIIQGYITKPYTPRQLVEKITHVTGFMRRMEDMSHIMQQALHPKLKEAFEYLNDNYHKRLDIRLISKKIGISYSHLASLFHQELGMNFTCYLNRLRVGKAKKIIMNTSHSLSDIMRKVGFRTEQHFFKQFKRFSGVTPQSLRRVSPISSQSDENQRIVE